MFDEGENFPALRQILHPFRSQAHPPCGPVQQPHLQVFLKVFNGTGDSGATVLNTTSLTGQIMESIVPFLTFFDHGIDDSKQFSHRGDQGYLFGFPYQDKTRVEGFMPGWSELRRVSPYTERFAHWHACGKIERQTTHLPESLLTGRAPTRAHISLRVRFPSSGTSASKLAMVVGLHL
jgi:hypothetical protein